MFRDWVNKAEGSRFKPEANRYALYVSKACPWANRCLHFLSLKGLEHAIDVYSVHPTWGDTKPQVDGHRGWHFAEEGANVPGVTTDGLNGCKTMRDLYDLAVKGVWDKSAFTTPVLWCKQEATIVNNESSEICRMLNSEFEDVARNKGVDLYPPQLADKVKELERWVYNDINNGVYKCGFATSQGAYEEASAALFAALDRVEEILGGTRYLAGDSLTGVDVWLFNTLVRFDPVYVVYFKTCKRTISSYHNITNYIRDLYQTQRLGKDVDMWNIRTHYFTSHPKLNPYGIVPVMPDGVDYAAAHDRATREYSSSKLT